MTIEFEWCYIAGLVINGGNSEHIWLKYCPDAFTVANCKVEPNAVLTLSVLRCLAPCKFRGRESVSSHLKLRVSAQQVKIFG